MDPQIRLLLVAVILVIALFVFFAGPGFFGLEAEGPGLESTPGAFTSSSNRVSG
jgi:hypothetical protein